MAPILREWLSLTPLHVLILGITSYHAMKAIRMVLLIRHRPISVSTMHKTQPNNLLPRITSRQLSSMRSISSILLTISLTCKYILIVRYSCSLFFSIRYGFTEKSSNVQTNNFGRGGKGNDRITVSVQDKARIDNADLLPHLMDKVDI